MSAAGQILKQVEELVAGMLAGHSPEAPASDADAGALTQLKRENTGLRTRVKDLEDRVTALENASKPGVKASAGTATVASKAHTAK